MEDAVRFTRLARLVLVVVTCKLLRQMGLGRLGTAGEEEEWRTHPMLAVGTYVRVATSFLSGDQIRARLDTGAKGVIQLVDVEGDMCVLFEGRLGNKWVYDGDRE